jgi:hypothetical protein
MTPLFPLSVWSSLCAYGLMSVPKPPMEITYFVLYILIHLRLAVYVNNTVDNGYIM